MARRKSGRPVSGVILLDKPLGISSNAALQQVRRFFNARKGGHTGALDPLATGMLPICLGEATKFSHYLLDADKAYRVTARLGERTTTSDTEGEVVATAEVNVTAADIDALLPLFMGEQQQSPSMYSALKHEGKPLYFYARQGIEVPRKTRTIVIHKIDLIAFDGLDLTLDVVCSKGTYIRTLIDDMGQQLGCGAHVTALHRHWVAGLQEYPMVTAEQLAPLVPAEKSLVDADYVALDSLLLAPDTIIQHLPLQRISADAAKSFQHGMKVRPVAPVTEGETIRLRQADTDELLGLAIVKQGLLAPHRVINDEGHY